MEPKAKDSLREQAERTIAGGVATAHTLPNSLESMSVLVHELEVHQAELEIQNETLRQTELELQNARDRYFDLFDLAPVAYVTLQEDGSILEPNLMAATLLRIERQQLMHRRFSAFVAKTDADRFHLHQRKVIETGAPAACELTLIRHDGEAFPARIECIAASGDPEENPVQIRMAIIDVTEVHRERSRAERSTSELNRTRARFENVAHFMIDSLILLTADGTIEAVNPSTLSLLGYSEQELVGRPFDTIIDEKKDTTLASLSRGGLVGRSERVYVAKDGRRIPVVFSGSPVRSEETAAIESIACIAHDITQIKRREEQIRLTVEASPIAMLMVDEHHRIVFLNAKTETLFGYSRSELIGSSIDELVPRDHQNHHVQQRKEYAKQPIARAMGQGRDLYGRRQDGTLIPIEVDFSPVSTPDGRQVLVAVTDVSRRKQLEEEVRQGHKMEAIGTLASGVAHDFNNLLMGISGCADIALDSADQPGAARLYIEEIKKSAQNGAAITRQLLTFSRKQEIERVVFALNELIVSRTSMLCRLLGADIELATELDAPDSRIRCDVGQLEQILMNLGVNARDAMPDGGRLTLSTRVVIESHPKNAPARPWVSLRVSDTGCGMSDETKSHLFEPFFTTKDVGKGTGLGLSTVYGIVKHAGGRISVESEQGQGTTFEILFPLAHERVTHEVPVPSVVAAERRSGTILVVEDESAVRMAIRHYLEGAGYRVLEAKTGPEAVECCENFSGPIDLLLTDIVLPGMNGDRVAREVSRLKPSAKSLFMSAYAPRWLADEGRIPRDVKALHKPFGKEALLACVNETLHGAATQFCDGSAPASEVDRRNPSEQPADPAGKRRAATSRSTAKRGTLLVVEDADAARLALAEYFCNDGWQVISARTGSEALNLLRKHEGKVDVLLTDYSLPDQKGDVLARQVRSISPNVGVAYMSGYDQLHPDPPGPVLEKPLSLAIVADTVMSLTKTV